MSDEPEIERRHPLAECEKCPLAHDKSTVFVPTVIPDNAKVAFVGEAPGRQEAQKGQVFIGPSGKLLDIVLEKNGIRRDQSVLTNAVACNKPSGDITPTSQAIRACRPRLLDELGEVETVVPMGNSAAEAVLGRATKITQERVGPSKTSDLLPGKRVIPTIHPAACLRFSDHFPFLIMDIGKINSSEEIKWQEPRYVEWEDERTARDGLLQLDRAVPRNKPVVVDIETGVEKDDNFTHPSQLLCIGLTYESGSAVVIGEQALESSSVRGQLAKFLRQRRIICHNGKFDVQVLLNLGFELQADPLWFDTMLASYVLDERPGTNSLDYNGQEILGTPDWKSWTKKYIGKNDSYAKIPRDVLYKYNAYDCAATWDLYVLFEAELNRTSMRHVHDMLIRFSNHLTEVERDGVYIDMEYNQELFETYDEILDPLEAELKPWVNNPRSWLQVKVALTHLMGMYKGDRSERENADQIESTDKESLNNFMERGITTKHKELAQFCKLMLDYRLEHKRFSTYVKGIRKRAKDGRVWPTYLLHGTTSGRTSCRNPNLQNIPRYSSIRKQIAAEPGNVFVQGDYAGAELRVVAVESGDPYLAANIDRWNKMVAAQLFGDDYTEEEYVRGKAMVHGTNYGREHYSIATEFDMDADEAAKYQREYLEMIPGVVAWQNEIKKTALSGQPLQTAFGRKRRFWLITKDNMLDVVKEALSFKPQSTASDINIHALCDFRDRMAELGYSDFVRVRIPVHDSILVECPEHMRDEIAWWLKEVMENAALRYSDVIPFRVDIEWGYNWGEKEELDIDKELVHA